ncbi:MAG: GTP-binding protein, partial [Fibrobacterales bacterium]|nr:GTP-binding protein [Fibrobacterales bacterium]
MRTLGILAHVDAGKTTLSERMLFLAGTIRSCGEVEDGLATLDSLPEEQERGITIETGVERLVWRGVEIQLLDTPGHVDFGSEVGGVLGALDGAVLVVSGTRHLQTQTLSAWNKLSAEKVPTLVFVNRLDAGGSDLDETLLRLRGELGRRPLLMTLPFYKDENLVGVVDVLNRVAVVNEPGDAGAFRTEPVPAEMRAR